MGPRYPPTIRPVVYAPPLLIAALHSHMTALGEREMGGARPNYLSSSKIEMNLRRCPMSRKVSVTTPIALEVAAAVLLMVLFVVGTVSAQVKPGDLIGSQNASKVQNLLAPGVYYKVQHGMQMKITPTERIDWPPPYKDATENIRGRFNCRKINAVLSVISQDNPSLLSTRTILTLPTR